MYKREYLHPQHVGKRQKQPKADKYQPWIPVAEPASEGPGWGQWCVDGIGAKYKRFSPGGQK